MGLLETLIGYLGRRFGLGPRPGRHIPESDSPVTSVSNPGLS